MHIVAKTFEIYFLAKNFFNITCKFVINQKAKSLKFQLFSNQRASIKIFNDFHQCNENFYSVFFIDT